MLRHRHIWKLIWSCVQACASMQNMWKDEVWWVARSPGMSGSEVGNVLPADLLLHSTPLWPAGEARPFSFRPLRGAAVAPSQQSTGLARVRGFNRFQLYSSLPRCKDRASCLSHHFQLLLSFTLQPRGHTAITRSSVTSIPNAVFLHFPTPQFPHKTPQWSPLTPTHFISWPVPFWPVSQPAFRVISASVWT